MTSFCFKEQNVKTKNKKTNQNLLTTLGQHTGPGNAAAAQALGAGTCIHMKSAGDGGHQVPHTLASQEGVALSPSPGLGPAQEVSPELPQLSSVSPKPVFLFSVCKSYFHLLFHLFNVCPKT